MMKFPYPYYFYGSDDSLDLDVLIQIPKELMPLIQEDRKIFLKRIEVEYELNWNTNLIVIEDGIITDTIYPKTWIDSVNNSLFTTYNNHIDKQVYSLPITRMVKRNNLLAIYKTVRTILSMLTRTHYRSIIKPISNGIHPFNLKIEALSKIDFSTINTFNQDNTTDIDIWKIIAFYLGQNISLQNSIEIYTKKDLCLNHPDMKSFIYREEITDELKIILNVKLKNYIDLVLIPLKFKCESNILITDDETIDMKKEIFL